MRMKQNRAPWESHDWRVETLESLSAEGGSTLAFTCRACERKFTHTTANNRGWATSQDGTALADEISTRWLAESCPRQPGQHDHKDRLKVKYLANPDAPK